MGNFVQPGKCIICQIYQQVLIDELMKVRFEERGSDYFSQFIFAFSGLMNHVKRIVVLEI